MKSSFDDVFGFGKTFLSLSPKQKVQFLTSITKDQCELIRQAALNVLINSGLELSDKDRKYFNRHINTLKKLASRRICLDGKRETLPKYKQLVTRVLNLIIEYISQERQRVKQNSEQDKAKESQEIKEGITQNSEGFETRMDE